MNDSGFRKRVLRASALAADGRYPRASDMFRKLRSYAVSEDSAAFLDFHEAAAEAMRGNHEKAVSLIKGCTKYYEASDNTKLIYESYLLLYNSLSAMEQYDEACNACLAAEQLTDDPAQICEFKVLCAEARMSSETVYDTHLFVEPCNYIRRTISEGNHIRGDLLVRACLIAAQACEAMNLFTECAGFCAIGIDSVSKNAESIALNKAFECSVLLCRSAVQTWNCGLIADAAESAYSFINSHPFSEEHRHWITLLYAQSLLQMEETVKAKDLLRSLHPEKLSTQNRLFFSFCSGLCNDSDFSLGSELAPFIPKNNIDELIVTAESIIDKGFPAISAEIYHQSLAMYPNNRELVLRPLASLLYRLSRFDECAEYYRELTDLQHEAVLYRAHSLAAFRSGDDETAMQQMLEYIEHAEDKDTALSLAASLSMEEGFPPHFCASLYSRLAAHLEKKGSSYETVDAYNRLGICLYRSEAPIEAEMNAFRKALGHAEVCEETLNSNIHAVIICNLAECHMRSGDPDLCYETFLKADEIFSKLDDLDLIQYSTCLKFMSDICISRGNTDEAAVHLQKAIDLLEPHSEGDPTISRQLSLCRNALGTVYFKMGKPELEVPELTKAIELVREYPVDNSSLALLYSNRGEAYERLGQYDLMAEDYVVSLSLTEQSSDPESPDPETTLSSAAKWLSIGRYREDSSLHKDAVSAYKTALDLLNRLPEQDTDASELTAFACYQLGNAYCHQSVKNFSASIAAYNCSLDILEKLPESIPTKNHLISAYEARAAFYEVFGEHALAASDLRRADALRSDVAADTASI